MLRGTLATGRVSAFGWSLRPGSVALILSVLPVCSVVMIRFFRFGAEPLLTCGLLTRGRLRRVAIADKVGIRKGEFDILCKLGGGEAFYG